MSSSFQTQNCAPLAFDHAEIAALTARGRQLHAQAIRAAFAAIFHLPARLAARGQILGGSAVQKA